MEEDLTIKVFGRSFTSDEVFKILYGAYMPIMDTMCEYYENIDYVYHLYRLNGINLGDLIIEFNEFMEDCLKDESQLIELHERHIRENDQKYIGRVQLLLYYAYIISRLSSNINAGIKSNLDYIKNQKSIESEEELKGCLKKHIEISAQCRSILENSFNHGSLITIAVKNNIPLDIRGNLLLTGNDKSFYKVIKPEIIKKTLLCNGFISVREVEDESRRFRVYTILLTERAMIKYAIRLTMRHSEDSYDRLAIEIDDLIYFRTAIGCIHPDVYRMMINTGRVIDINNKDDFKSILIDIAKESNIQPHLTAEIITDLLTEECRIVYFHKLLTVLNDSKLRDVRVLVQVNGGSMLDYCFVSDSDESKTIEVINRPSTIEEWFVSKDDYLNQ